MSERQRIVLTAVAVMACMCILVTAVLLVQLYEISLRQQRVRLEGMLDTWAAIIESIAEYATAHGGGDHPGGAAAATLAQLTAARSDFGGIGVTGEFMVSRRNGEAIEFLLGSRGQGTALPEALPWDTPVAQPSREALLGRAGVLQGRDYRGRQVLVAYRPLPGLGWGLTATIELDEVRAPFLRAAAISLTAACLLVLGGALVVRMSVGPMAQRLEDRTHELEKTRDLLREERDQLEHRVAERTEELRRLNRELDARVRERTAQLEASNRELEAFSYSVSHDLRAPLRHITGFIKLLRKNAEVVLDDTGRRHLGVIDDAAGRMGHLIDDLLTFSRMGRVDLKKTPVDLDALVRDVIADLAPDCAGREIEWRTGHLGRIRADESMMRLVFQNLLGNALKFTQPRARASIELAAERNGPGEVTFSVRDNGVGFDMKYGDKLFQVFQRLHSREEFPGTGIGLANVRRMIDRHGGRVWAEGVPGAGAAFYFALPT